MFVRIANAAVRVENVSHIQSLSETKTIIVMKGGSYVRVQEAADNVLKTLDKAEAELNENRPFLEGVLEGVFEKLAEPFLEGVLEGVFEKLAEPLLEGVLEGVFEKIAEDVIAEENN